MRLQNIKLILEREIRDQLRDRRTLFMIAVLPVLLYPLLGMTFLQVGQFLKESQSRILIVGLTELPQTPKLVDNNDVALELYSSPERAGLIHVTSATEEPFDRSNAEAAAEKLLKANRFDAIVHFPPSFGNALTAFQASLKAAQASESADIPVPSVYYNAAKDTSRIASDRIREILERWRHELVKQTLATNGLSTQAASPFEIETADVSEPARRRAVVWSKILPFVLLVWALTGAFYPAIDICAGEKERGTLETLLTSPAQRSEIVLGKLITVMLFSILTSLLNILSLGLTAGFIVRQFAETGATRALEMGPPPLYTLGWLILALLPLSAMFSALSLALAAMAGSTKEGQYYLMPLMLVTMPLLVLPMLPAAQLDLGTSLIPVTGVMLLLRNLIEGHYAKALLFAGPVIVVTGLCCLMAIRWAIDQFNNEFVLFRESERLDLRLRLKRLFRERGDTPTVVEAVVCGTLLLVIRFFAAFLLEMPTSWRDFVMVTVVTLVFFIATPVLVMTITLTRRRLQTLSINVPSPFALVGAFCLAVVAHPLALGLSEWVRYLYPIREGTLEPFNRIMANAPISHVILLLALLPAICEELAFRGFILSGLRHVGSKWRAILVSSVFFGLAHGILQQSIMATMVGVVIGYIAVQTGSIFPCMVFHFVHNMLAILSPEVIKRIADSHLHWLTTTFNGQQTYSLPVIAISAVLGLLLLNWFRQLPFQRTPEERLHEALDQQSTSVAT